MERQYDRHEEFYMSLPREEKQLVTLLSELYDGSWEEMVADMRDRLAKKPFILKLAIRIEEDLERVRKLSDYESTHQIKLGVYAEKGNGLQENVEGAEGQ